MKILFPIGLTIAVVLGVAGSIETATARSCYSLWAEAEGSESNYRHFVYVENDCDEWIQCTVWTDVDPQPPKMISVAPNATESREINGHSQFDDPKAFGSCRFK